MSAPAERVAAASAWRGPPGRVLARAAYGGVFVVILPVLLVAWARSLDQWVNFPVIASSVVGLPVALAGFAFMIAGTSALWRHGRGLPMSAFPPGTLVTRGIYRLVADPLYVGAVAVSVGVSIATGSAAGLWIVSPVLALSCVAWVAGFERDATRRRFGAIVHPALRLPRSSDASPPIGVRGSVYVLVLLPWLVLYLAVEQLGVARGAMALDLAVDRVIPVIPWSEGIYITTYFMVGLAPLLARREDDLRRFAVRGLIATAFIIPLYLLVPVVFAAKPVQGSGFWELVMRLERLGDAPVTAMPAFHVVWAFVAAELYASTWRAGRAAWLLAALIAASCITTGMHSVLDVAAGMVAWLLVKNAGMIWRATRAASEAIANSWAERTAGPLRFMSHGVFVGVGATVGTLVSLRLGGTDLAWWVAVVTAVGGAAAAVWAQAVEGSSRLLRPFGYFGGVFGIVGMMVVAHLAGADAWRLMAAYFTGLAFGQGTSRIRCLINGCCHGRAAHESLGIRYTHPRTRVVRLTDLRGVPIHPTQVYSLIFTVLVGFVLLRLWALSAPLSFIAGMYFVLVGLGRFVEEHYRGEPQTATIGGLRLYQWLALSFVIGGAAMTTISTPAAPSPTPLDWPGVAISVALGVIGFGAFGVDFPRSSRRYARLT